MTSQHDASPGGCGERAAFDSPAAALGALLPLIRPAPAYTVKLTQARGHVLAQDIATDRPSPPADVSAMDGFAVRMADLATGRLAIAGEVRIGREPPPMPGPGACLRMVTGGAVPAGADAVLKREDVREEVGAITLTRAVAEATVRGQHIRRMGENAPAGSRVVEAGVLITAAVTGAAAAVGAGEVQVRAPLNVVVVSTGDELVDAATTPTPWQLRDSNGPALRAMIGGLPFVQEASTLHLRDDEACMNAAVAEVLRVADALIMTGGVSAGHRDFVPSVLGRAGVRTVFHGVAQRPGRPVLGGVTEDGRPVFGLPGNPVSVLVTARRMVVEALRRRAGMTRPTHQPSVRVTNNDGRRIGMWWQRPVRLTADGAAELVDLKGSGDLIAAGASDGFVELPPQATGEGPWPYYAWMA